MTVILDADMMRHERLNYHPLENTATTNIAREDLARFIRSCGHEPRILAVAAEAGRRDVSGLEPRPGGELAGSIHAHIGQRSGDGHGFGIWQVRRMRPSRPAGDIIKDATTATFAKDVLEASRKVPVIVDFWAPWCGPCKQLTPILEKVVRAHNGKVRLVKINIDENPAIAGQLRVQSIPTVYAFRDGRPLDGFMGAQPESAVKAFVDRLLGEEAATTRLPPLEAAEKALEAGDLQGAAEIYAAVLQEDAAERRRAGRPRQVLPEERRHRARRADHRPGAARQARARRRRQRARRARPGAAWPPRPATPASSRPR